MDKEIFGHISLIERAKIQAEVLMPVLQAFRAELGEDPWGPNRCEFHVELKSASAEEQEQIQNDIENILKKFPGIQFEVTTFLGDRIGETITGEISPVVVNVFGTNLDVLDAKAQEIAKVLNGIRGRADVKVKTNSASS